MVQVRFFMSSAFVGLVSARVVAAKYRSMYGLDTTSDASVYAVSHWSGAAGNSLATSKSSGGYGIQTLRYSSLYGQSPPPSSPPPPSPPPPAPSPPPPSPSPQVPYFDWATPRDRGGQRMDGSCLTEGGNTGSFDTEEAAAAAEMPPR